MMHIGFTGTQDGMTDKQAEVLATCLRYKDFYGHHGDCIGSDKQFDAIARTCRNFRWMYIYPSILTNKRAFCRGPYDIVAKPKQPLVRNHDMVEAIEELWATPKTLKMEGRSGTWATIRYARTKPGLRIRIIAPNGALFEETMPGAATRVPK